MRVEPRTISTSVGRPIGFPTCQSFDRGVSYRHLRELRCVGDDPQGLGGIAKELGHALFADFIYFVGASCFHGMVFAPPLVVLPISWKIRRAVDNL